MSEPTGYEVANHLCSTDPHLEEIVRTCLAEVPGGLKPCYAVVIAVARAYLYGLRSDPSAIDRLGGDAG